PFVISNLVNIVSADFFDIGFVEYAAHMIIPNVFSLLASMAVLYIVFRKHIPTHFDGSELKKPKEAIKYLFLFCLSWGVLAILLIGYYSSESLHVPVSFIAGIVAIIFLLIARRSPVVEAMKVVKGAPC